MAGAIVFGSTTGYTEDLAFMIYNELKDVVETAREVQRTSVEMMQEYDVLVIGIPTWNHGELQSDWADRYEELDGHDFTGTSVAFFGSGDGKRYPENFQDAMGVLWRKFESLGASLVGKWPIEGYLFNKSQGLSDDGNHFVGLAFQKYDSEELTEDRIKRWAAQIREELTS